MKRAILFSATCVVAILLAVAPAHAGDVSFSIGISSGRHYGGGHYRGHGHYSGRSYGHYYSRSSYCGPSYSIRYRSYPSSYVYYSYREPTVVYTSPPVVYAPSPVVYTAPPVVYAPRVVYGSTQPAAVTADYPMTVAPPAQPRVIRTDGWQLLGDEDYRQALTAFAALANEDNKAGAPKIGYALASAGLDQLDQAVWAMRRALHVDPEASKDVLIDEPLRETINKLIDKYIYADSTNLSRGDAAFMIASMHWLLRDVKQAQDAITRAVDAGDGSESALNLKRMIEAAKPEE